MEITITAIPDFENHLEFIKIAEINKDHPFGGKAIEKTNSVYRGINDQKDIFVLCTIDWVKQEIYGMDLYKPFHYEVSYHDTIHSIVPHLKRNKK